MDDPNLLFQQALNNIDDLEKLRTFAKRLYTQRETYRLRCLEVEEKSNNVSQIIIAYHKLRWWQRKPSIKELLHLIGAALW